MSELIIRLAREIDAETIAAIYNDAIANTTATFDTEPISTENRRAWLQNRTPDFPVLVAEQNGRVVGYTALNRWSDRRAYDITAELSLYVTPELHRRGIGRELFKQILAAAEVSGIYTVISRITADNDVSLKLHERFGFRTVGVLQRCGKKFNRILDVVILQKLVKQHDTF